MHRELDKDELFENELKKLRGEHNPQS